jgi:hypothetical protein
MSADHGRLAAAKALGLACMPVVQVVGLSEAQKRFFLLSDNWIGMDARLDRKALANQTPELILLFEEAGISLYDTDLEVAEIDALVIDYEDGGNAAGETVYPTLTALDSCLRRGDVFDLGAHRLAIGDARDIDLLDRLMVGEKAEVAFLDPPYNVPVHSTGGRGQTRHPDFAFASGEMSRTEFVAFWRPRSATPRGSQRLGQCTSFVWTGSTSVTSSRPVSASTARTSTLSHG